MSPKPALAGFFNLLSVGNRSDPSGRRQGIEGQIGTTVSGVGTIK